MSNAEMIELCDCGEQFTIKGVDRNSYNTWRKFGRTKLADEFTKISPEHLEQLMLGLCVKCYKKEWAPI